MIKVDQELPEQDIGHIFIGICLGGHAELRHMLMDHPVSAKLVEYIAYIDDIDLLKDYI